MKKYFCLVLKSTNGTVYPSGILYDPEGLQDAMLRFHELGVKVLDVKEFDFNPADYE